jgi:hypothetical protein
MKKLTSFSFAKALACSTALALTSAPAAFAADQETTTSHGPGWHPLLLKGPVEIKDGQILSGTSGTIGGERMPAPDDDRSKPFNDWWNGKYMLGGGGNFGFDLRRKLATEGVSFNGNYQGAFFGVIDSEKGARGFWDQQINFGNEINFGKLLISGISFQRPCHHKNCFESTHSKIIMTLLGALFSSKFVQDNHFSRKNTRS